MATQQAYISMALLEFIDTHRSRVTDRFSNLLLFLELNLAENCLIWPRSSSYDLSFIGSSYITLIFPLCLTQRFNVQQSVITSQDIIREFSINPAGRISRNHESPGKDRPQTPWKIRTDVPLRVAERWDCKKTSREMPHQVKSLERGRSFHSEGWVQHNQEICPQGSSDVTGLRLKSLWRPGDGRKIRKEANRQCKIIQYIL